AGAAEGDLLDLQPTLLEEAQPVRNLGPCEGDAGRSLDHLEGPEILRFLLGSTLPCRRGRRLAGRRRLVVVSAAGRQERGDQQHREEPNPPSSLTCPAK